MCEVWAAANSEGESLKLSNTKFRYTIFYLGNISFFNHGMSLEKVKMFWLMLKSLIVFISPQRYFEHHWELIDVCIFFLKYMVTITLSS